MGMISTSNDRDRERLNAAIGRGDIPRVQGQSQVVRIVNMPLTNAQGGLNQRGQLLENLVNERDYLPNPRSDYNTDPYRRGTRREGRYEVAQRRSGQSVRVGKYLKNGSFDVLKQGESYYRDNKSEYVIHIPVWAIFHGGDKRVKDLQAMTLIVQIH